MLYFIAGDRTLSADTLAKHGLTDVIDNPNCRELMSGPDGKSGMLIADGAVTAKLRYDKDGQTWRSRKAIGHEGTWVGMWDDSPPTVAELQRDDLIPGEELQFNDGTRWVVPVLRRWRQGEELVVFECALPTVLDIDDETGIIVPGNVVKKYRSIWDTSLSIADEMLEQMQTGTVQLDTNTVDRFVADVLTINYRVSWIELAMLGAIATPDYRAILRTALDWETMMDAVKNLNSRRLAGSDGASNDTASNSGETQQTEAASTDTAQQ